jgi:NACalpha-BTF3-like transcription factor
MKIANRLDFAPIRSEGRAYELREFQGLPSLPKRTETSPNAHKRDDAIFWAIKLEAIHRIRIFGWLDHDALEEWAFELFITRAKDRSTLKAKVRNVWQWYKDRDWKIDGRVHTMSRADAGRSTAEKNAKKTEAKVRGAVEALKFLKEKITVTAVAKQAGVSRNTARKYLDEMGLI